VALAAGCGTPEEGPERFHVSGTVTYEGQPVKTGTVYFTPDSSKDNKGPQGVAQIVDGQYSTEAEGGKGHVGGPHKLSISTPEFNYEAPQAFDMPKEQSEQKFDLKKSEVKLVPSGGTHA
jgi:hypothetical protein